MDVVVFELDGAPYALPAEEVREELPLGPVTPVPWLPAALCGATNVGGRVVPVLDLIRLFGGRKHRHRPNQAALLVRGAGHEVVIPCDVVKGPRQAEPGVGEVARGWRGPTGSRTALLSDGRRVTLLSAGPLLERLAELVGQEAARLEVDALHDWGGPGEAE